MSDPTKGSLEETNDLLRVIQRSLDRSRLGLINDPPGRRTIYANRVRAPDGCCWYFWDKDATEPVPIEESAVRGVLHDVFVYEKSSDEGTTTKVRACLACGDAQYEVETSLYATSGAGLMSGLLEAGDAATESPITIGVRPADKDEVLFVDVFTDAEGLQINGNQIAAGDKEAALAAVKTVRSRLGLDPDPWTDRFNDAQEPAQAPSQAQESRQGPPPRGETPAQNGQSDDRSTAANPTGDPSVSGTQNGRQHPSEKMYDGGKPSPEAAGQALVGKAQEIAAPDTLAKNVTLPDGALLSDKIEGFLDYCGREQGYLVRCLDVMGVQSAGDVAVAELENLVELITSRETLQQNESFEPDDELPF